MSAREHTSTTVAEIDMIDIDETVDHDERERRRARSCTVEIRTPAGFEAAVRVHPDELVEKLAKHAEQYFVNRGELAATICRSPTIRTPSKTKLMKNSVWPRFQASPGP